MKLIFPPLQWITELIVYLNEQYLFTWKDRKQLLVKKKTSNQL